MSKIYKNEVRIFLNNDFYPAEDACDLRDALNRESANSDDIWYNVIIDIVCRRTQQQRQELQLEYKILCGRDLIDDVQQVVPHKNLKMFIIALLRPLVDFYCFELKNAMDGIGNDAPVLIEIFCTLTNAEIVAIKERYLQLFDIELEAELRDKTTGYLKHFLLDICKANRDESGIVDVTQATLDIMQIRKSDCRGTDESQLYKIMCQRSYAHLRFICKEYYNLTEATIDELIAKEFSGYLQLALLTIYQYVINETRYFANLLHDGFEHNLPISHYIDHAKLMRVIVRRAEVDFNEIKQIFSRLHGKHLMECFVREESNYMKAMCSFILDSSFKGHTN